MRLPSGQPMHVDSGVVLQAQRIGVRVGQRDQSHDYPALTNDEEIPLLCVAQQNRVRHPVRDWSIPRERSHRLAPTMST
jgi:hypothetical protein